MASDPQADSRESRGELRPAMPPSTEHMVRLALGELTSTSIRTLAAYWNEIRGRHHVPLKQDLDPARIKPLLPYLILAEYHVEPLRIRYRLVGTEQVRFSGQDFTGQWLHEIGWEPRYVEVWSGHVAEMIATRLPIYGRDAIVWTDRKVHECEWGVFPLSADGETVGYGLGIEDFSTIERRIGWLPSG